MSKLKKALRMIYFAVVALVALLCAMSEGNRASEAKRMADWMTVEFPDEMIDYVSFECREATYHPEFLTVTATLNIIKDIPIKKQGFGTLTFYQATVYGGEGFWLCKLVNDTWKMVPFAEVAFPAISLGFGIGSSHDYRFRPEMFDVPLSEGQYRVVTELIDHRYPGSSPDVPLKCWVWADFTINKDAPKQGKLHFVGKPMTLDDVRELAAKGDNLSFFDFNGYQAMPEKKSFTVDACYRASFYVDDGMYELSIVGAPPEEMWRVILWQRRDDGVPEIVIEDIRDEWVD